MTLQLSKGSVPTLHIVLPFYRLLQKHLWPLKGKAYFEAGTTKALKKLEGYWNYAVQNQYYAIATSKYTSWLSPMLHHSTGW